MSDDRCHKSNKNNKSSEAHSSDEAHECVVYDEYIEDEMKLLLTEAMPFFRSHVKEFKEFILSRRDINKSSSILSLCIEFVSVLNLPFNMKRYMMSQSAKIQKCLDDKQLSDGDNGTKNHELKQQLVADWIKSQAPQHRELQIELQKQCLLHYKNEFEQAFLKEFPDS